MSIHVCDDGDGGEYLRFDAFDGDPHYHYLTPGVGHTVIIFDEAALGDMLPWTLHCLRERLPQMLTMAGAGDLVERIDIADVHAALPEIERLAERALSPAVERASRPGEVGWAALEEREEPFGRVVRLGRVAHHEVDLGAQRRPRTRGGPEYPISVFMCFTASGLYAAELRGELERARRAARRRAR